jgi:hypothetical protein
MAICHLVPDGDRALSQPYPPMVVPFNPCGGATPATPATPLHRLFDFATVSTDPEGC